MLRSDTLRAGLGRTALSALACALLSASFAGCSGSSSALPRTPLAPAQPSPAAGASDALGTAVAADRLARITSDLRALASPSALPNPDGLAASPASLAFTGTSGGAQTITISSTTEGIVVPLVVASAPCVRFSPAGALAQRKPGAPNDPNYYATFSVKPLKNGACSITVYEVDRTILQTHVVSELAVAAAVGVAPSPSPSPAPQTTTVYVISSATTVDRYDGASSGAVSPQATYTIPALKYGDVGVPSANVDPVSANLWLSDGYVMYQYVANGGTTTLSPISQLNLSTSSFMAESGTVQDFALDGAGGLYTSEQGTQAGSLFAFSINGAATGTLQALHSLSPAGLGTPAAIAADGNTVAVESYDCLDTFCDNGYATNIRLYHTPLADGSAPFQTISPFSSQPAGPVNMVMDRSGNLYVTDPVLNQVDLYPAGDGSYSQGMTATLKPNAGTIMALAVDRLGGVYTMNVASPIWGQGQPTQTVTVTKFAPNGGAAVSTFGPIQANAIAAH
jgi:hypothetical protein